MAQEQGGSAEALAAITEAYYQKYSGRVLRYAMGRVNNLTEAEDIASDSWLRFHKALPTLRNRDAARGLLWAIVRRAVIDQFRTRETTPVPGARTEDVLDDPAPSPEKNLWRREVARILTIKPEGISGRKWLVYMRIVTGPRTMSEVARDMERPIGTVGTWVFEVRKKQRKMVTESGVGRFF